MCLCFCVRCERNIHFAFSVYGIVLLYYFVSKSVPVAEGNDGEVALIKRGRIYGAFYRLFKSFCLFFKLVKEKGKADFGQNACHYINLTF